MCAPMAPQSFGQHFNGFCFDHEVINHTAKSDSNHLAWACKLSPVPNRLGLSLSLASINGASTKKNIIYDYSRKGSSFLFVRMVIFSFGSIEHYYGGDTT
mmetsp:Transcript_31881/g.95441  ORF Transcript_31881/g.95441 Transcript_31881/m.95441 type:complete len:100 (-) Transcript_31881:123-422(-)